MLAILGLALGLVSLCSAQAPPPTRTFQWSFQGNSVSSTVGTCQEFGIVISKAPNYDGDDIGVPPYYMRAYEQGGSVRTTLLGSDNLKWIVDNPVGSKLLLNVIDSNDTSGGVAPKLFTVDTGSSTNCVKDGSDTSFTVSANISSDGTGTLQPCQPWGLRIHGGVPPYNISILQMDSPYITNVTTNQDDDAYTYINRADGNKLMMAGVADATGRIAYGNPSVMTEGETNRDCGSLISTSGDATELDAAAEAERDVNEKTSAGLIAGVTVGAVAALAIAGVLFFLWRRRRRYSNHQNIEIDADTTPTPYMTSGPLDHLSITSFAAQHPTTPYSPKSPGHGSMTYGSEHSTAHFDPYSVTEHGTSSGRPTSSGSTVSTERPTSFPLVPVRRSKASEAGLPAGAMDSMRDSISSQQPLMEGSHHSSGSISQGPWPSRSQSAQHPTSSLAEREIIYQHRDGGVVRELPPPYADRSLVDSGE